MDSSIQFDEIVSDADPEFERFYAIYAQAFPLEDEREPPEAFRDILDLNADASVQERYGPYTEIVSAIRLERGGPIVGGVIFGATTSPAHISAGIPASVQAIYVFFLPQYQGKVPMSAVTRHCRDKALALYGSGQEEGGAEPLIFFEVNNPLRMSPEQIETDTLLSGTDPFRRYPFWCKKIGALPLDFAYVQPKLREDAEPIHYLDLFCTAQGLSGIPAGLLLNHLNSFVSVSVLKGHPASEDSDFAVMKRCLQGLETVRFIDRKHDNIRKITELGRLRKGG